VRRPGPRERHLPLAGENEENDDDDHPERGELRLKRRNELDCARTGRHGRLSVPTAQEPVKLQKRKLLSRVSDAIVFEAMPALRLITLALGLILPR